MKLSKRPYWWAVTYFILLFAFTVYVLLDTFVIERKYKPATDSDTGEKMSDNYVLNEDGFADDNITISISQTRYCETDIYIADITLSDISYLKTAMASDTYGKNVKDYTSVIARQKNAILAINGDYYGARNEGYVVRQGQLFRSLAGDYAQQDLVIYSDGTAEIINECEVSAEELTENGARHVFSFGPGLIDNGEITVGEYQEVDRAKSSNPRTAIGYYSPLHFVFLTADGRTDESAGLTLYQLAQFMKDELGTVLAYNLDGGGSSTFVFDGKVINKPTSDGDSIRERSVSDIVYIGY